MQSCADPYGIRACRRWLVHPAPRIIYTTNQDRAKHISLRRRYTLLAAFSHLYPNLPLRSTSRSLFAARAPRCLGACRQHQAFITGRLAGETMKLCGAGRRCRWLLEFRGCLRYGKSSPQVVVTFCFCATGASLVCCRMHNFQRLLWRHVNYSNNFQLIY